MLLVNLEDKILTISFDQFYVENPIPADSDWSFDAQRQKERFIEIASKLKIDLKENVRVVGEFFSNGIKVPAVEFKLRDGSSFVILSDNFFEYAVSVESAQPLSPKVLGKYLFMPKEKSANPHLGFPESRIHGSFDQNQKKFSAYFNNDDHLDRFVEYLAADPIERFFIENPIDENNKAANLARFQREYLKELSREMVDGREDKIEVIGAHEAEGILLPVVHYTLPNNAECILWNNFHHYGVSLKDSNPLEWETLRDLGLKPYGMGSHTFEKFPEGVISGSPFREKNLGTFTAMIKGDNAMRHLAQHICKLNQQEAKCAQTGPQQPTQIEPKAAPDKPSPFNPQKPTDQLKQ